MHALTTGATNHYYAAPCLRLIIIGLLAGGLKLRRLARHNEVFTPLPAFVVACCWWLKCNSGSAWASKKSLSECICVYWDGAGHKLDGSLPALSLMGMWVCRKHWTANELVCCVLLIIFGKIEGQNVLIMTMRTWMFKWLYDRQVRWKNDDTYWQLDCLAKCYLFICLLMFVVLPCSSGLA